MSLLDDERGVVIAYLTVFVIVVVISLTWIVFNEVLLQIGNWATLYSTESSGGVFDILILFWRATPFVILFSSVAWAINQALRHTNVLGG